MKKLNVGLLLGIGALVFALGMNYRYAIDDYGIKTNTLSTSVMADGSNSGDESGSVESGDGSGLTSTEYDTTHKVITINKENYQEKIKYSELFDSVKYIRLENCDDCLIADIDKIIFFNNCFYILDKRQNILFNFSDIGKLIWKIDKKGNGPGEYRTLMDFDLDNNRLYLYNPRVNVLEYDLSCNYLNKYPVNNVFGTSILVNNESFYFNTCNNPTEYGNYHLLQMEHYGKSFKKGIEMTQKNLIGKCITFNQRYSFFRYQDKIRFFIPFSTKVFSIEKDSISVQYFFDFKNNNLPESFFENNTYEDLKKFSSYAYGFNSFWENNLFIYFNINLMENNWDFLYSKQDNKLIYGYFSDDIAFCWPKFQIVNDDFAIGFRTMDELFNEYNYSKEERKNTVLKEIIDISNDDDNPVLLIYYFKKF